ncbi:MULTISPECIES: amidohydrolase family protein [Acidianus]|uniref:Amidohydrolase n=1 Tax=Candidatus Acidianus copahuensis TaxID=1160895 RepID=A0A031LM07_9CREN|nr:MULTISPECIES: amidohydrolase family protein [Acidianus]EZQ01913.1 amidohydrolase [Candidatus Acidianus copahuensis]NON62122.1 amidohydrolase family protein [Acidianus sp. RZ1]
MIDTHAHWFSAKVLSEKEFMMASSESWREGEINADVLEMNSWRPFYLLLRNRLKKLLGNNFLEVRNKMIRDDPLNYELFLFKDAKIDAFVIDEGFGEKDVIPIKYKLLFRIETLIDSLLSIPFDKALEIFEETLRKKVKEENYAGFKSIIAYRTGLKVECSKEKAEKDFLDQSKEWYGRRAKGFRDYLFCKTMDIAKDLGVPFQVHTGVGDRDIKLELTRPSYLTELVRKYEGKIVFVHAGFPYHRETAWMSYIFPSVYIDLSQVFPFATTGGIDVLREIMQISPLNKIMYGSDVFGIPEVAWLSAKLFSEGLQVVLDEMEKWEIVENKELVKDMILTKNAEKIYFS